MGWNFPILTRLFGDEKPESEQKRRRGPRWSDAAELVSGDVDLNTDDLVFGGGRPGFHIRTTKKTRIRLTVDGHPEVRDEAVIAAGTDINFRHMDPSDPKSQETFHVILLEIDPAAEPNRVGGDLGLIGGV